MAIAALTTYLILQPDTIRAANTDIACSLVHATLTLGVMEPLQFGHQDSMGEVHLVCRNFSDSITSATVTVELGETQSGYFVLDRDLGGDGIRVRLYADAARTRELALGGGSNSTIQNTITINPKTSTELIIPIYARADLSRKTSAGSYTKAIPVIVTYE